MVRIFQTKLLEYCFLILRIIVITWWTFLVLDCT